MAADPPRLPSCSCAGADVATARFPGLTIRRRPDGFALYYTPTDDGAALLRQLLPGGGTIGDLLASAADCGVAVRIEPGPWPWSGSIEVLRGRPANGGEPPYSPLGPGDAALWRAAADPSLFPIWPLAPGRFSWFAQCALLKNLVVVVRCDLPVID